MNRLNRLLTIPLLLLASIVSASSVTELTKDNVFILDSMPIPVIIDFYSNTCPPCKLMKPIFEECAKEWSNKYCCMKANIEDLPELAKKYEIKLVPTFVVISNGKELGKFSGYKTKEQFKKAIEEIFNPADLSKLDTKELNERLHDALLSGAPEYIKRIIGAGAEVNSITSDGRPLIVRAVTFAAIRPDGPEKLQVLLDAGVSLTFKEGSEEISAEQLVQAQIAQFESMLKKSKEVLKLIEKEQKKRLAAAKSKKKNSRTNV